jgi:hypothetical protein
MLKIYRDNKNEIHAYFKGQPIEGYQYGNNNDSNNDIKNDSFAVFGGVALFMVFFIIIFGIWVWALVVTIKYFSILPLLAQIVAILGLITGIGPVVTLIAVYIGKEYPRAAESKFADYFSPGSDVEFTPRWG